MNNSTATRGIYQGHRPLELPAYSIPEAARYLGLPPSTVRSWVLGGSYRTTGGERAYKAVIRPADAKRRLLSFLNLVELHVLSAIRREHRVKLPEVRKAVGYLSRQFGTPHPLASQGMLTGGGQLFVEHLGSLVNVTQEGQTAMREVLRTLLQRVDRDPAGIPIRLYPFPTSRPETARRSIVIDPEVQFGRPCLVGTGVPTTEIAERIKAGDSVRDVAEDIGLDAALIEEAIRYELPAAA